MSGSRFKFVLDNSILTADKHDISPDDLHDYLLDVVRDAFRCHFALRTLIVNALICTEFLAVKVLWRPKLLSKHSRRLDLPRKCSRRPDFPRKYSGRPDLRVLLGSDGRPSLNFQPTFGQLELLMAQVAPCES